MQKNAPRGSYRLARQALRRIALSIRYCLLTLIGWSLSVNIFAVGLGDLKHSSFLGEPLQAHIELINITTKLDLGQLKVRQIQGDEAQSLGVDLVSGWMPVRVSLEQHHDGYQVSLSTRKPVKEPLINVLIELTWPNGKIFREYNVMLNPPGYNQTSGGQASPGIQRIQSGKNEAAARRNPPEIARGSSQYTVMSGDTLAAIAQQIVNLSPNNGPSSQTLRVNEVIDWLLATNPDAFIDGDMDRLIAGAALTLPANINQLPPAQSVADNSERNTGQTQNDQKLGRLRLENPDADPVSVASAVESRLSANEDLMEALLKENQDLRERLDQIENSEYIGVLKSLVEEQRAEISHLHEQLREAITSGTLRVAGEQNTPSTPSNGAPDIAQASSKGFEISTFPLPQNPLILWLVVGTGALLLLLATIAGFTYFRKRSPAAVTATPQPAEENSDRYEFSALWHTEHVSNSTTQKYYEVSEEFPETETQGSDTAKEAQTEEPNPATEARKPPSSAGDSQKKITPETGKGSSASSPANTELKRPAASNDADEIEIDEDLENYLKL